VNSIGDQCAYGINSRDELDQCRIQYNNDQVAGHCNPFQPGIVDGNFTWQNGNPVSLSDGATVSHYDFDLNSAHQPGDYFSLVQL
jgi:hypothetical protein